MSRARRILRRPEAPAVVALAEGLHPVLASVYARRGITRAAELEHSLAGLIEGEQLGGLQPAVELLTGALVEERRILVVGDFDADGATATALAVRALRALGAAEVHYLVPNRFEYGYGLTPEIVAAGIALAPHLLVTVDHGISSIDGVAAARARGVRVLVTDHHLPGATLPDADAVVNPCLPDNSFPSKSLAGVGVIFYVLAGLRAHLRARGWFSQRGLAEPSMARFLDLVAVGTVADVVALDRNNRILVEQGLRRIRAGACVPGIRALLAVAGRARERAIAADLGFAVGPRLNAAGRLQDMSIGIECLLSDSDERAEALARELDGLNRQRREIGERMQTEALAALEAVDTAASEAATPGICLYDPGWHQGVIGILAARLKDRRQRPAIAFADGADGELKGSARSVPGLHIRDVLATVAARHPRLIARFGGHAMAAGLSLPAAHLARFRRAFNDVLDELVDAAQLEARVYTDGELAGEHLSLEVAELLRTAGPWGQGFPEPTFEGVFDVIERRSVGEGHLKLRLRAHGQSRHLDAIAFNAQELDWPGEAAQLRLVYRLEVNEYRGRVAPQLVVVHLESVI